MIDIIMPVRSTPLNLLRDSLESILQQSTQDYQLWICDDTPQDWVRWKAYQELLVDYQQKFGSRWNYLRQDSENFPGVSGARNQLLQASSSPFVSFLDSDDCWKPTYLTSMLEALQSNEADIWVTEIISDNSSTHLLALQGLGIDADIGMENILHDHLQCYEIINFLPEELQKYFWMRADAYFSGLVCLRKCVDTHQFSTELPTLEDTDLLLQWVKSGYRVRSLSVSKALVVKKSWDGQLNALAQDEELMTETQELFSTHHSDCYLTPELLSTLPYSHQRTLKMFQHEKGARARYQLNQGMTFNIISRDEWEIMNL